VDRVKDEQECQKVVLAQSNGFRVDHCSCGSIHVHAGSLTLRLEEQAAEILATVMAKAKVINRERAKQEARPLLRLVPETAATTGG